ncbi:acyl-CoA:lysophosphatidylglycerol acyltransferase 1-like [Daktulosphaira vitifoliae]|uniref:acyl-CoA:lysophosphatidylglycerol acyltransferase 1-like n=1 Tax=Daktulosphaira vitifoliae TaxID=58002 RepID=UPI0021A9FE7D|nr:acyl-CoA:lysophosphatidylglycerol acyltransferase 1-like [Daktulosphaira vitifoliae]
MKTDLSIEMPDGKLKKLGYKAAVTCKVIIRVLFVLINNIYCIPTYCVWMIIFFPLRKFHPKLYWKLEGLFFHWLLAMVSMWSWSAGYNIVEVGDDIRLCLNDRTLVLVNHQSTADVPMLMTNFNAKPGVLPNIMWIMDRIFKFTNFGIVSVIHKDFFILSGKDQREQAVKELRNHIKSSYIPLQRNLIILFPEGGFLRKRLEASQRYAQKNNLPFLEHVTLPRLGAFSAIIDELSPKQTKYGGVMNNNTDFDENTDKLTWILDITIAYSEGKPLDLPTIIMGQRRACCTHMYYRLFPSSVVPRDQEEMTKWLFDRWEEKERLLEIFYSTGEFPGHKGRQSSVIQQDCVRFLILHLFFIASSYAHYRIISYLISLLW